MNFFWPRIHKTDTNIYGRPRRHKEKGFPLSPSFVDKVEIITHWGVWGREKDDDGISS